jgi:hypothetical protein
MGAITCSMIRTDEAAIPADIWDIMLGDWGRCGRALARAARRFRNPKGEVRDKHAPLEA